MIYSMVPFPVTLSDPSLEFQGHGIIRPIDAVDLLCAQFTRDLLATAKFLFFVLRLLLFLCFCAYVCYVFSIQYI